MQRMWLWMALCLFVGGAVGYGVVTLTGDSPKPQQEQAADERSAGGTELSKVEREQRDLRLAVLGHDAEILELAPGDEGWTVHFEMEANEPEIQEILDSVHSVFKELARTDAQILEAVASMRTSLYQDVYGHKIEDLPILRVQIGQEAFEAIEWAAFEPVHFERVADEFWLHELLHAQYELLKRDFVREELGLPPAGGEAGGDSGSGGDTEQGSG